MVNKIRKDDGEVGSVDTIVGWVFGITILLWGLSILFVKGYIFTGIGFILISLIILPPVRKIAHKKTGMSINAKSRAVSVIVLFVVSVLLVGVSDKINSDKVAAKELATRQQKDESQKQRDIAFFEANRATILYNVQSYIEGGDFDKAVEESQKYLLSNDKELISLSKEAKEKARIFKETKKLLNKIKNINQTDFATIGKAYAELSVLNPDNAKYAENAKAYKEMSQKAAEIAAKEKDNERIAENYKNISFEICTQEVRKKAVMPSSVDINVWYSTAERPSNAKFTNHRIAFTAKNKLGNEMSYWAICRVSDEGRIFEFRTELR